MLYFKLFKYVHVILDAVGFEIKFNDMMVNLFQLSYFLKTDAFK